MLSETQFLNLLQLLQECYLEMYQKNAKILQPCSCNKSNFDDNGASKFAALIFEKGNII